MANMNIKKRLSSIESELRAVAQYISMHHGLSKSEANEILRDCEGITEQAAMLTALARSTSGEKNTTKIVKNVRKALGFTYP